MVRIGRTPCEGERGPIAGCAWQGGRPRRTVPARYYTGSRVARPDSIRRVSFLSRLFNSEARAAERDLERRVAAFRAEVLASRSSTDADALARIKLRPAALGLTEDDVALELEMLDGLLDVLQLRGAIQQGRPLPLVDTSHRALAGEACHFMAPAFRADQPNDPGGKLFFTSRRLLYLGAPSVSCGWAHVADVRDAGRDLIVRIRPETLRTFRCNSYVDTLRGAYIASQLLATTSRAAI